MASRKLCYTKTGLKRSPKRNGRCPQGSNRTRRNKDAATGRKGGYAAKRTTRGGCSSANPVKVGGYSVKGKMIRVKSKKTGKWLTKKKSISYSVGAYCRKKAKGTGKAPAKAGKPCFTKTGRKKPANKSGKCPAGTNRSRARKDAATARKGGYAPKAAANRGRRSRSRSRRY